MAEKIAKNWESLDEGPAVGVQLSWSHVYFGQKLPFEVGEWEASPKAFKNGLVEKEEWLPVVGAVINTYQFASYTRANGDIDIVYPLERSAFKVRFTI